MNKLQKLFESYKNIEKLRNPGHWAWVPGPGPRARARPGPGPGPAAGPGPLQLAPVAQAQWLGFLSFCIFLLILHELLFEGVCV